MANIRDILSPRSLLKNGTRFTDPEVLAAARRIADYVPDPSLLRSPLFLRLASALFEFYKTRPESASLFGQILRERLGKLGDYLFVILSQSPEAASSNTRAAGETNDELRPEDRRFVAAVREMGLEDRRCMILLLKAIDGQPPQTVIGALTLLVKTNERVKREGKLPIKARAFVLEMGETAKALAADRMEAKLEAKEDSGVSDVRELAGPEMRRIKEEVTLAVEIMQKADLIGPSPN
jgi:hypothetical protein